MKNCKCFVNDPKIQIFLRGFKNNTIFIGSHSLFLDEYYDSINLMKHLNYMTKSNTCVLIPSYLLRFFQMQMGNMWNVWERERKWVCVYARARARLVVMCVRVCLSTSVTLVLAFKRRRYFCWNKGKRHVAYVGTQVAYFQYIILHWI